MKQQSIFQGAATALVTPLNKDGVDYPAFEKLINWLPLGEAVKGVSSENVQQKK